MRPDLMLGARRVQLVEPARRAPRRAIDVELRALEQLLWDEARARVAARVDVVEGPGSRPRAMSVA